MPVLIVMQVLNLAGPPEIAGRLTSVCYGYYFLN